MDTENGKEVEDDGEDSIATKRSVPAGVFNMCAECRATLLADDIKRSQYVCSICQHHMAVPTRDRVDLIFDAGTWQEYDAGIESVDPLAFKDSKRYPDRLRAAKRK